MASQGEEIDVDAFLAQLAEHKISWSYVPSEHQGHFRQGVYDGMMGKPRMPHIVSHAYVLGWLDGRFGREALKIMKPKEEGSSDG